MLLTHDYTSSDRIASMILLSDGYDNYLENALIPTFKELMINQNKTNYTFTLHTFGYGASYNYELMKEISLIMDGSYFHVIN